jgi:hypothetical protein
MPRHGRKVSALFAFNICAVAASDRSIRATAAILRQDYINIYAKCETSATVSIFPAVFCPRSDIPFCISRRLSRGRHLIRRFAIAPLIGATLRHDYRELFSERRETSAVFSLVEGSPKTEDCVF